MTRKLPDVEKLLLADVLTDVTNRGTRIPADVATQYESLRGYAPRDLRWFMLYAAVQWGIVFLRTGARRAHFGEQEMPAVPEELIHNKMHLESQLSDFAGF